MSFFKKVASSSSKQTVNSSSKKSENASPYDTGKPVDKIVENLLETCNDTDASVRGTIRGSLMKIARLEPILVLNKCSAFLADKSNYSNKAHRIIVLDLMSSILDENKPKLPVDLANTLVAQAVAEMVSDKGIKSDWQSSGCALVVSLCSLSPDQVAAELLKAFPAGNTLPHYFVLKALADFAHTNPIGFVPHLKEILTRLLPVLSLVKQDNFKWVFAAAMGRFAEAIIQSLATPGSRSPSSSAAEGGAGGGEQQEGDDEDENNSSNNSASEAVAAQIDRPAISLKDFAQPMHTALNHILNLWITSSDVKIRLVSAEAIGNMSAIIDTPQLVALVPKLVQTYVLLMKKEAKADQTPVTQGFCTLLDVCVRDEPASLEPHIEIILQTLHFFSCKLPRTPALLKNHNELLRCIETVGRKFTDQVLSFLQRNLESKDVDVKTGTLNIIKHLVSRLVVELDLFKGVIVSSVRLLLEDPDLRVQKHLAQVIIAMASQGYLESIGGQQLVTCIIKNASATEAEKAAFNKATKGKLPADAVSPDELQTMCDNILTLFVSTLGSMMDQLLWPFLLEFIDKPQYQASFAILCKCIAEIGMRKKQQDADDYLIDFEKQVNIAKPPVIFARLIAMLICPYERNNSGKNILRCMYALAPIIHERLFDVWSEALPDLKSYLDGNYADERDEDADDSEDEAESEYNQEKWEAKVLNLVNDSIDAIGEDEFTVAVGDALASHASYYKDNHTLKKGLLALSGLIVKKAHLKEFVIRGVSAILENTDHSSDVERLGCARGLGQASEAHTDVVLEELQKTLKPSEKKKQSGLFGGGLFSSSSSPVPTGQMATGLLSYGYCCLLIPPKLLAARAEVYIINNFLPALQNAATLDVKENGLRGIDLVAKSLYPQRIKDDAFTLKPRAALIEAVLNIINPPPTKKSSGGAMTPADLDRLRILGLTAITTMIRLPPRLPEDLRQKILDNTLHFFGQVGTEDAEKEKLIMVGINKMLTALLEVECSQKVLMIILNALGGKWLRSASLLERQRAAAAYVHVLKDFARNISEKKPANTFAFDECGSVVGTLVPRITEPSPDVRRCALDSIYLALRIQHFLSKPPSAELPEAIQQLGPLRSELACSEPEELFALSKKLASILSASVDAAHLKPLLMNLLSQGLLDVEGDAANGACVVINGMLRIRGAECGNDIALYVDKMLEQMPLLVNREHTLNGLLHCLRMLARHHTLPVISHLLEKSVPYSVPVAKSFQVLCRDQTLIVILLNHILELTNNSQLYDEKEGGKKGSQAILTPTHTPTSAIAALAELLKLGSEPAIQAVIQANYSRIICSLLLRIGIVNEAAISSGKKQDASIAGLIEDVKVSLRAFFEAMEETEEFMFEKTDAFESMGQTDKYSEAVATIMGRVAFKHRELIREMHEFVMPYVSRAYVGQRVTATAMSAQHLLYSRNDRELVHSVTNCLLTRSGATEHPVVKIHALRGLANIVSQPRDEINKYVTPVIGALMSCFDDPDNLVLQAMNSIERIFEALVDEQYIEPVLVNVCLRLNPLFDKQHNAEIREGAVKLFGTLGKFGKQQNSTSARIASTLQLQIFTNLPCLILHLADESVAVQHACKVALRRLVPHLGELEFTDVFADSCFDTDNVDASATVSTVTNKNVSALPTDVFGGAASTFGPNSNKSTDADGGEEDAENEGCDDNSNNNNGNDDENNNNNNEEGEGEGEGEEGENNNEKEGGASAVPSSSSALQSPTTTTTTAAKGGAGPALDYTEIAKQISQRWVKCFPTRINDMIMSLVLYFSKTPWSSICSFGALLLGYILASLPSESDQQRVNMDQATTALIGLLKNPSSQVRHSAAHVLGLIHKKFQ